VYTRRRQYISTKKQKTENKQNEKKKKKSPTMANCVRPSVDGQAHWILCHNDYKTNWRSLAGKIFNEYFYRDSRFDLAWTAGQTFLTELDFLTYKPKNSTYIHLLFSN